MPKRIVSVGVPIAGDEVEYASLSSKLSLLDWDIIIFRPDISEFTKYCRDTYMGKPSLDDNTSVSIIEAAKHWRGQLEIALKEGKTVFVFLSEPQSVYVATGEKRYSGTGRSQTSTRIVTDFSNYNFITIPHNWSAAEGSAMILDPRETEALGSYWASLAQYSRYHILWEGNVSTACIHTKSGKRPVGFRQSFPESGGNLFLVPDLDFEDEEFSEYDRTLDDEVWTAKGEQFGRTLVAETVQATKSASENLSKSAEPQWAGHEQFELNGEAEIRRQILEREQRIEALQKEIDSESQKLGEITGLRDLLFETGKPLEFAIIKALEILGFTAENFSDGASEFDVVFTCAEGRLIGEAEGKDNKQVNITKLRQLSTNILEDLAREEVVAPAKGVLFGNAHRFTEPSIRGAIFTDKCITTAQTTSVALVSTVDLFLAARCFLNAPSDEFSSAVRQEILRTNGVVDLAKLVK